MNKCFSANKFNKSQIIRDVYSVNPAATNREIRMVIESQYGFRVGSNLIVQTLGSEKGRFGLATRTLLIVEKMRKIVAECGNDIEFATRCLRMAG